MNRRQADVLGDEHKDGSLWINHNDEIWAWVQDEWRMLRNSGLWSGMGLYSGESQMRRAGPFTEVDYAHLISVTSTESEALLAVATLYVDSFAPDEAMSLTELWRLQEIEDILERHGRRY